jgi:phosphoserine phosphatase
MTLSSWNDTAARKSILDFLEASGDAAGTNYIPPAERIATFDNDGTLWVEQPAPAQVGLLLGKLIERVKSDPSLAEQDPYKGIITQDPAFMTALAQQVPDAVLSFLGAVGKAWEGTSPEQYEAEVRTYLASSLHPRWNVPWTDLVYQPMLELFDLLRANDWRVYVCSGGGRDFMRVFSEDALGVLQENVIGTSPEHAFENGKLVRRNELRGTVTLGPGKPEAIFARTGRLPRFAAGNGDVDLEMLEVADFGLVVVHDDEEREYATSAAAEKLLEAGERNGWTMVSMKNDWSTVFKGVVER